MVCSGGGLRGIAFLGAFRVLEMASFKKYNDRLGFCRQLKACVGVSVGAIIASIYVFGRSADAIERGLRNCDLAHSLGAGVGGIEIGKNMGLVSQERIEKGLRKFYQHLKINPDISLKDAERITNRKLCILASSVYTGQRVILSGTTTPHVTLIDAVLASSCIPLLFPPRQVNNDLLVDGGILDNFPYRIFPIEQTLGLSVTTDIDRNINGWTEYCMRLCFIASINRENERRTREWKNNTLFKERLVYLKSEVLPLDYAVMPKNPEDFYRCTGYGFVAMCAIILPNMYHQLLHILGLMSFFVVDQVQNRYGMITK